MCAHLETELQVIVDSFMEVHERVDLMLHVCKTNDMICISSGQSIIRVSVLGLLAWLM